MIATHRVYRCVRLALVSRWHRGELTTLNAKGATLIEWRHYLESAAPSALKLLSPPLSHRRTKASLTRRQARWVEITSRCAITAELGTGKLKRQGGRPVPPARAHAWTLSSARRAGSPRCHRGRPRAGTSAPWRARGSAWPLRGERPPHPPAVLGGVDADLRPAAHAVRDAERAAARGAHKVRVLCRASARKCKRPR